jgi:hypothetical protein
VISSTISLVDPVTVEIAAGFGLLRGLQPAGRLGPAVGETVGAGARFVLLAFGLLADRPQVYHLRHLPPLIGIVAPGGSSTDLPSNMAAKYAETLARIRRREVVEGNIDVSGEFSPSDLPVDINKT